MHFPCHLNSVNATIISLYYDIFLITQLSNFWLSHSRDTLNRCVLYKDLVVRRELHGSDGVEVFLALGEEVVPSANNAALVLVIHHLQLVCLPRLSHLQ